MSSMIVGTWSLIRSVPDVITGAQQMSGRIHRLLQPGILELKEADRRRLLGLQKRVECLVQPLNFLLLWSKDRDSCVRPIVLSAQELLFAVCDYVERFAPPQLCSAPQSQGGGASVSPFDASHLEYYLRELDFACNSVGLAVSIANAQQGPTGPPTGNSQSVSPSALLKASRRIQEMFGRSGDLCACIGRLYTCSLASTAAGGEATHEPSKDWSETLSLASFKVVATTDGRLRRRYAIRVESCLPLSQVDPCSAPEDLIALDSQSQGQTGLNASGPLGFPIEVALRAWLSTASQMQLPAEPERCYGDLGVDAPALVWQCPPPRVTPVAPEFEDAVLVDSSAEDPTPHLIGGASDTCPEEQVDIACAFVFDYTRGQPPSTGICEVEALSPLDALYLAQLCALDDGHRRGGQGLGDREDASPLPGVGAAPPHLQAADEVLLALLGQRPHGCADAGK